MQLFMGVLFKPWRISSDMGLLQSVLNPFICIHCLRIRHMRCVTQTRPICQLRYALRLSKRFEYPHNIRRETCEEVTALRRRRRCEDNTELDLGRVAPEVGRRPELVR